MDTGQYHYQIRSFDRRHDEPRPWTPTEFQCGAIEAAFFTADPEVSPGEYVLDWDRTWNAMDAADRARFIAACEAFELKYRRLLMVACGRTGNDMAHAGRDYHYTSAGHGCGFCDGDWDATDAPMDYGRALSTAAEGMPLPEIRADLECEEYRESGSACGDCDGCEAGPGWFLE